MTKNLSDESDVRAATEPFQAEFPYERDEEAQVTRREFCNFLGLTSAALFAGAAVVWRRRWELEPASAGSRLGRMGDEKLKSAYELAMERFQKKDAEAGVVSQALTDEQKAAIAEVRNQYQAKIAELEILHRGEMASMMDPAARELAEAQYRQERGRLERERDSKIEQARGS